MSGRFYLFIIIVIIVASWITFSGTAHASLMAYYPFEDLARDATGHGYDGAPQNGVTHGIQGHSGSAYWFDGIDDYIELPIVIDQNDLPSITIGAWVKFGIESTSPQGVNSSGAHWSLMTRGGIIPTFLAQQGRWTFVAAAYDRLTGTVTLYVDGKSMTFPGVLDLGPGPMRLGAREGLSTHFLGAMDDVFIFIDEALTPEELDKIRTQGINPVPLPGSLVLLLSAILGLGATRLKDRVLHLSH